MTQANSLPEALAAILAQDMPMSQALAAYAAELRRLNPTFASAYDALVARLQAGDVGAEAPKVGQAMPDFVLPDQDGRLVRLEDFTRDGPVVVSINRGHWCPFCRIELSGLEAQHAQLAGQGARFVSIMPERQEFTRLVRQRGVNFPVLSDIDHGYALTLGLAFWIGAELESLMAKAGRSLPAYQGANGWFLPVPATFVVGADRRILARHVDPDFRLSRMQDDEIAAALQKAFST